MLLVILFYLFIIIGTLNLIHFALYLIGANVYDIRSHITAAKTRKLSKPKPYKPLVSVLIPAHNEEKVIKRALKSVWGSDYEHIEIIVINDGSYDKTADRARTFINQNARAKSKTGKSRKTKNTLTRTWKRGKIQLNRHLILVNQTNKGKASALNNGLKNHAHGELVMMLDADSMLHKNAISNAVKYFVDKSVAGVAANVRIIEEPTPLGILQRFEHMIGYRSKKFFTITNSEIIIGGVASTYRRSVVKKVKYYDNDTTTEDIGLSMKVAALGNKKYKLIYGADIAAMTEGVSDFVGLLKQRYRWKLGNLQNISKHRGLFFSRDAKYTKSLTWYRLPMSLLGEILLFLEPVALGYVIYVSLRFMTLGLFISAYMAITAYLLLIIWPDEHLSNKNKLKASLYVPLLYFLFYLMNVVQLVSAVKCVLNRDKIIHPSERESTWVSPRRAGRAATFS
jgi:cellulose synthase/poly-beta-1,6-N-acetylglucosamine synthase-like glycosyltransferase